MLISQTQSFPLRLQSELQVSKFCCQNSSCISKPDDLWQSKQTTITMTNSSFSLLLLRFFIFSLSLHYYYLTIIYCFVFCVTSWSGRCRSSVLIQLFITNQRANQSSGACQRGGRGWHQPSWKADSLLWAEREMNKLKFSKFTHLLWALSSILATSVKHF